MATIIEENQKQYRQALDLYVSIEPEPADGNTLTAWNTANANLYDNGTYKNKAEVFSRGSVTALMDLSGEGFINDGSCQPIDTDADGSKYGILLGIADENGAYTNPVTLAFTTANTLTKETMLTYFVDGEKYSITASSGKTFNVTINEAAEPYGRVIITRAKLGDIYEFTKENILNLEVTLRGDAGYINPQLPISALRLQCYIPTDGIASLVNFNTDTPVYYSAGYSGDMSEERIFYVSEKITYSGKAYTVEAEDATKFLDSEAYYTNTQAGTQKQAYEATAVMVKNIIQNKLSSKANITFNNMPSPRGNYWYFVGMENARNIIARYMALCRLSDTQTLTYVDAGRPNLYTRKITTSWDVQKNMIADYKEEWDEKVTTIEFEVTTPYKGEEQEVHTIEGTRVNYIEWVDLGAPFVGLNHWFEPRRTNGDGVILQRTTMYGFTSRFRSNGGYGKATFYATPILQRKAPIGTYAQGNPVFVGVSGAEYYGDYEGLSAKWGAWTSSTNLTSSGVPLYNIGARNMLSRSGKTISFTWRGNPKMQPWDKINFEGVTYTLETITHNFEKGGFISTITAREGAI